jgi:uncharacterized protein YndB with AHSA1/START domain
MLTPFPPGLLGGEAMPPPVLVQVAREFDVSPARVFDAWLDPELIGRWMFGPALRDETVLRIAVEPREGGRFSFLVLRDGQEIDHAGEYLVLARPHRLTFTWGVAAIADGNSRVTVDIAPRAGGCTLELQHELRPEWAEYADRTREGWTRMLGCLAEVLA